MGWGTIVPAVHCMTSGWLVKATELLRGESLCHRAQPDPEGCVETRGPDHSGSDLNFNPVKGCWCQWMNREHCHCGQSQLTHGYTPDTAVKQTLVLIIQVQCFWSGSLLHAGAESAEKQAPTMSAFWFSSAAPRELLVLPSCSMPAKGMRGSDRARTAPGNQGKQVFT